MSVVGDTGAGKSNLFVDLMGQDVVALQALRLDARLLRPLGEHEPLRSGQGSPAFSPAPKGAPAAPRG